VTEHTHRLKLLTGLAAAGLALSSIGPSFAQTAAPAALAGAWSAGSDGTGPNTYVGRVETPRQGQSLTNGSNLLVSGWAVDTSASGWAGIDAMSVYVGTREAGTKLADGAVGLNRPDVADGLGPQFMTAGFSAVVPGGTLSGLPVGPLSLSVYLHTPNKGWWFKTVNASLQAPTVLAFPSDPIVTFVHPIAGEIITQRQKNNKYTLSGFALDRNPPGTGQNPGGNASGCHCGVGSVFMYMDLRPGMPGYVPAVNDLGNGAGGTPCGIGCGFGPVVNNYATHSEPAVDLYDTTQGRQGGTGPGFSYVTAQYGTQFDLSGFSYSIDPAAYNPNAPSSSSNLQPNMFHTVYAVATSSVTGKISIATTTFYIRGTPSNFPPNRIVAP